MRERRDPFAPQCSRGLIETFAWRVFRTPVIHQPHQKEIKTVADEISCDDALIPAIRLDFRLEGSMVGYLQLIRQSKSV
jgi:hypothetical protein